MIIKEVRGRVGVVTIDRHERRNALDLEHVDLRPAVADVVTRFLDDPVTWVLIAIGYSLAFPCRATSAA